MGSSLESVASDHGVTGHNILVTGGAGFIGSHLVDALVQTNRVTVLDDFSTGSLHNVHPQATVVEGDVRDSDTVERAMQGIDTVFHQAGLVSVDASIENPPVSQAINAGGTLAVLDCARRADARVIAASSAAVYGEPATVPISEHAPFDPSSPYGVDKVTLDHYTRLFSDLYGLQTVALRYFNVYGPRQSASDYSGVISTFLKQAHRGTDLTVHDDGSQTRDFVHVTDVVRANILAATTDKTGEAFNVGTGTERQILDLAEIICDLVETESNIGHVAGRAGDIDRSCADTSKAATGLGFDTTVSLREGLATLLPAEVSPGTHT